MIGFGVGTIIFGIMSYLLLKEIPTLKTFICILLAIAIILIQVTNVIDE
jgi:multidrug transporter EmrE-like cation transporter